MTEEAGVLLHSSGEATRARPRPCPRPLAMRGDRAYVARSVGPLPLTPWTCRWGCLAGSVVRPATLDSDDLFWTCSRPQLPAWPLFVRDRCAECPAWEPARPPRDATPGATDFHPLLPEDPPAGNGTPTVRRYGRGDRLFSEGDPLDGFYTIAYGRVKLFKTKPSGREVILEMLTSGEPIGIGFGTACCSSPVSATALEETACVIVSEPVLFRLIDRHPALARRLFVMMNARLVELMSRAVELAEGRVTTRVARLLLKLADQVGRKGPGGLFIPVWLSRQELADLSGITLETSIRIMSRWNKQGLVRSRRDGFLVTDRTALEAVARR